MENRYLTPLLIAALISCLILLGLRFYDFTGQDDAISHIHVEDVTSLTLLKNNAPIKINQEDQKTILYILNQSLPVGKSIAPQSLEMIGFEEIIIHQKDGPDILIKPIAWHNNALIFFAPDWNEHSYLQEYSNGRLRNLLHSLE